MTVQHAAYLAFADQLFGMPHAAKKIHHMACHEGDAGLFASADHFIAVLIRKSNGLFTEYVLSVLCRCQHGLLMQIIGCRHDDRIYIGAGAERLQVRFQIAAQFIGNGLAVFRVQHANNLCSLLLLHDAAKLRAKISGSYDCISNGRHDSNSPSEVECFT